MNRQKCLASQHHFSPGTFCNATWDGFECWRQTRVGESLKIKCPYIKGFDTSYFVTKHCEHNGLWNGKNDTDDVTNYSICYTSELLKVLKIKDVETKSKIAGMTRMLEFVGFSCSFICLIIALFIFLYFRSLRTHKTHIHKNLFFASLLQVMARLTIYIDQSIIKADPSIQGIDNTAGVCEVFYVFLEFTRLAIFTWFLVEGLYLNQVVAISVFAFNPNYILYHFIGWGLPIIITSIWTAIMSMYMKNVRCWAFYNLSPYYWIVEGPRLSILFINLVILLNTLRILLTTVKESSATKSKKLMKTLKAVLVLVHLLGLSNILQMIETRPDQSVAEFAVWAFVSHFLSSFQGFIISFIYCFFNKQVKNVLGKRWRCYQTNYLSRNDIGASMRMSANGDTLSRSMRRSKRKRNLDNDELTSHVRVSSYKCVRKKDGDDQKRFSVQL